MMVSGLKRVASTRRSRNWLADQRFPAPARSGARSPWNVVSGNGPEWQRMQVVVRSSTSAPPRAATPAAPVSDAGMPSTTILYGAGACALAASASTSAAIANAIWSIDLAKGVRRDGLKPFLRLVRLAGAQLARCVDRACGAAFDLGEDVVLRLVVAREREAIAGRGDVVAGAGQPRRLRRFAGKEVHDSGGAGFALRAGSRRRFRNAAAEAG